MHILRFGCLATDLLDFFYKLTTLRCYGNTELVNDILQNIWLCATDCNYVFMNKTIFCFECLRPFDIDL